MQYIRSRDNRLVEHKVNNCEIKVIIMLRWTQKEVPYGSLIADITIKNPSDHSNVAKATIVIDKTNPIFKTVLNTHLKMRNINDGSVIKKEDKNKTKAEWEQAQSQRKRSSFYTPYRDW